MASQIFKMFAAASLLVTLAVAPLLAQWGSTVTAQIPFAFVVGDRTLPAGEYTVKPAGAALLIRSMDGKAATFTVPRAVQSPRIEPQPRLVFHQYGDTYFLSELWSPRNNTGMQLSLSPRERELAQGKAPLEVRSVVAQQR